MIFLLAQDVLPTPLSGLPIPGEATLQLQILLGVLTVIGFVVQIYRENRGHKWQVEERNDARRERADLAVKQSNTAQALSGAVDAARQEVIQQMRHTGANVSNTVTLSRQMLETLLHANTQISKDAFNEANHVNIKIADLTQALVDNGKATNGAPPSP